MINLPGGTEENHEKLVHSHSSHDSNLNFLLPEYET